MNLMKRKKVILKNQEEGELNELKKKNRKSKNLNQKKKIKMMMIKIS